MAEDQLLDNCGCCEGIATLTPHDLANPPGLGTLAYRVGTHGSFKTTMLAGLTGPAGIPDLATRADDDPAIALLDAAAVMLDVLTFYQERIANEGYLRTATERLSVLELARAIGYELKPGVAASTHLAFEMETAPGAPAAALIAVGTKVQSLPGQDEKPQTFETVEPLAAERIYNQLRPQTRARILPKHGDDILYLQGAATNLKPGDALLLIGDERRNDSGSENWDFRRVAAITAVTAAQAEDSYTIVKLDQKLGSLVPYVDPARDNPAVHALRLRASLFGYNAPEWRSMPVSTKAAYLGMTEVELNANPDLLFSPEWPNFTIAAISDPPNAAAAGIGLYGEYFDEKNLTRRKTSRTDSSINFSWGAGSPIPAVAADTFSVRWTGWVKAKVTGVHTFFTESDDGVRLWVDGKLIINNWTDHGVTENQGTVALESGKLYAIKLEYYENGGAALIRLSWAAAGLAKEIIPAADLYPRDIETVYLDAVHPQVVKGSWLVLSTPGYQEVYSVESAVEDARAGFTLSAKVSQLVLKGENMREKFDERLRATTVFAHSEELPLAAQPITEPIGGNLITLDRLLPDLPPGRTLIVSGKRVRVTVRQAITITATDGVSKVTAMPEESLLLEAAPVLQPDGRQIWQLTDKRGFTGTVTFTGAAAAASALQISPPLASDAPVAEVAAVKQVTEGSDPTEIELSDALERIYDRGSVVLYANVAAATHGETHREVLGGGDGAAGFQQFTLKQKPLTFVTAASAGGTATTLAVRADDVLWEEQPSLYGLPARARAYIVRQDDEGNVTITFGDGKTGARLPSGVENVVAAYRTGIGAAGMVKANQLSLLITRPLGVQKVTNPLAPRGAADPESREEARQNAPFTVQALDRIVSLGDFESFARAFAGIGKARATWLWDGEQQIVHVTVAAAVGNGADYTIDPQSPLFTNLRKAMDGARDRGQRLVLASYDPLFFRLSAAIAVDRTYLADKVLAAVADALTKAYSFARRDFDQPVHKSEVIAAIQSVPGVTALFLKHLYLRGDAPQLNEMLPATFTATSQKAHLLLLDPQGVELMEMTL